MIIDSPIISGSYLSTGSLSQTGNVSITGSLTATAGISGSFSGSGADLFGIPASGITGLNLSQISSGSVSASISPSQGLLINTSVSASNFTGSFTGSLTGIATSASYAAFALTSSYSLGGSGFPFSGSAVITGSLLVSGSAQITGSLSVSGSISASLFGTASQATSASYALTASYLLGYISPFPFTGSAEITGSLIVTGSVSISTLTTGSGVRYVIADHNGLLSAQTASAAIFTTQQVVSTAGQTTFPITNGYATGYVTVFVNGTKLSADEYVDTSGTNIVFLTGSTAGDNVEFQKYLPAAGVSNNTLRSTNYFTATTGQTNFSVNYTPGLIDIFYNGAKLDNTEYTAANGTSITLATASAAGDRLEVDVYSYQVGAFSGIGGTGAANQLAYFNTSNSITGSNAFTVSGSAVIITGSLIVSGSGTFTNIGPAVFSGSVTAVGGFSGSFSGNADSASLAQNSLLLDGTGSLAFATTSSFATASGSISTRVTQIENVYATTGSNSFRANQSITGSLVVSSTITAQTLVVQTVTSSIIYSSGSNVFGNSLSNTQTFTGSVNITGSSHAIFGNVGIGTPTVVEGTQAASSISIFPNSSISNGPLIQFAGNGRIRPADAGNRLSIDGNALHLNSYIGGNIIMNTAGGNVGIGTNSPLVLFDVRQPFAKTDTTRRDILYASNEASPAGLRLSIVGGASQAVRSAHLQTTDWGSTNDGSIVLQPFGGNVGIGIENPSSILYISAQSDTVGGNGIRLGNSGVNRIWNTRFGTNTDLSYNLDFYDGSTWSNRLKLTYTGTLSVANRGIATSSMPAGSVIQVVNYILTSGFSTTNASDQDTGLKASITPTSSTSKILVLVSANARATNSGGNCYVNLKLVRGAYDTGLGLHNGYAVMGNYNSSDVRGSVSYSYLDSPATTSSTQYVVTLNSNLASTVYINSTTSPSTITLMEIAQ